MLLAELAFAGKVVTYTATSTVSQEDANNTAIAGVAKQISSNVKANQTLSKEEVTAGKNSSYKESYRSSSQVTSNIDIKGISVTPVKTDKGFKATASLDLDEYTADLQLSMKTTRQKVEELQNTIKASINERQYARGITALDEAKKKIDEYQILLKKLAFIYPVNESFQLKHRLPELESLMQEKLSQIRIEGPTEQFNLTNSEMPPWKVTVYDAVGPVANFPLIAKQSFKPLLERRTQNNGTATFNLRNVNYEKGPYVIVVEPNFSDEILNATGLRQQFILSYQVNESRCPVRIECKELANVCNALEKALAPKAIHVEENSTAPLLKLSITSTEGKALKINDNMTRYSYNVDLSLKGNGISFITSAKENGKNATDATIKAIAKMDYDKLKKQLKCN